MTQNLDRSRQDIRHSISVTRTAAPAPKRQGAAVSTLFNRLPISIDDGAIGDRDQGINDGRCRLATTEMRLDRGLWCIRQYEASDAQPLGIDPTQGIPRKPLVAGVYSLRLARDAVLERLRPNALHKVIPVVE